MKNILEIPVFLNDTYSSIENRIISSSEYTKSEYRTIWLIRPIQNKFSLYKNNSNRGKIQKPHFVEELEKRNIEFIYENISKYNIWHNFKLFSRLVKEYKLDAIVTHFGFERYYGAFIGKLLGIKVIYYEHMYWNKPGTKLITLKKMFFRYFTDMVIVVSKFIGNTFPKECNVHVIHNGIDTKLNKIDNVDKTGLRKKLGIPLNKKVILMVAAYRQEKRYDLALQICEKILSIRNDVSFVFVGYGPDYNDVKEEVVNKNLLNAIMLTGHKDNVHEYYAMADITILTALYEPFGNVVIESMLNKTPVVAFNSGGPSEIIDNINDGFLVENENINEFCEKIIYLLENEAERDLMGEKAARKITEKYTLTNFCENYKSALDEFFKQFI